MIGNNDDWKFKEGTEGVLVLHVYRSFDDKTKFDNWFDPTGEFFTSAIASGMILNPFYRTTNGPIFILDGTDGYDSA